MALLTSENLLLTSYDEDDNYSKAAQISAMPSANVYTITFGDISGADFSQTCKDTLTLTLVKQEYPIRVIQNL